MKQATSAILFVSLFAAGQLAHAAGSVALHTGNSASAFGNASIHAQAPAGVKANANAGANANSSGKLATGLDHGSLRAEGETSANESAHGNVSVGAGTK